MARNTKRRLNYSKRRRNRTSSPSPDPETNGNDLTAPPAEAKPIHIDKRELRDACLERVKNRPIRERIVSFFRREPDKDYRELIINSEALERRVAMMVSMP